MAEIPPSQNLKDLLIAHVAISNWQLEISTMPDTPDDIIMISDTVGLEPNPKWLLDFPSCQVMVRGSVSDYLNTYREAKAVKDILLGVTSFTTGDGDRIVAINMQGDLGFIGRDESMRPMFVINFALIIEPQVVANSNRLAL